MCVDSSLYHKQRPQSNQRGIETTARDRPIGRLDSLNRTSVGLKLGIGYYEFTDRYCLNRTSVGLKQASALLDPWDQVGPQSNQRGIETSMRAGRSADPLMCLNRTSVGLKPHRGDSGADSDSDGPQSNQRGIETLKGQFRVCVFELGLNRTSVGLKQKSAIALWSSPVSASIEPAWD